MSTCGTTRTRGIRCCATQMWPTSAMMFMHDWAVMVPVPFDPFDAVSGATMVVAVTDEITVELVRFVEKPLVLMRMPATKP